MADDDANLTLVREIALALPEVEERLAFGDPVFVVKRKFLARLRAQDQLLVLPMDEVERDIRMQVEPNIYSVNAHYVGKPFVLICMATVDPDDLRDLFAQGWQRVAPKRLAKAYEGKL